ncbi:MAG: hypothetical protein MUO89_04865 [Dehalococcoidia bacterium]|nr:hypothetical protein [Dehalococcoidia bacterium]
MAKRIKKPTVKLEQRQEWLRRYEAGESPPKIAENDRFDVRTVRRHIEQAKQEKEVREARLIVLRSALENHYTDFCRFAEKLDAEIAREEKIPLSLREDRLWSALRQHLPRSPLWSYLNKWDELQEQLAGLEKDIAKRLTEELKSDLRLKEMASADRERIIPGLVVALGFQIKSWAQEHVGLTLNDNFQSKSATEGLVNVHYGFASMEGVNKDYVSTIKQVLSDFESKIIDWEEYGHLQKLFKDLGRLKQNSRDELAIITMRRVVPGRCRYCPI